MRLKLVVFSILFLNSVFSQVDSVRFYSEFELIGANPDTVFAISLKKEKRTELPDWLFDYKNLTHLDLGKNKLNDVNRLGDLKKLKYLNLEKNDLEYFPIGMCQLSQLETLIINRNHFTTLPGCIENCTSLQTIDLWDTPIVSLPEEFYALKLKKIDFSGIRFSPGFQTRLKENFPNTELVLDPPCDCMD